ncbi:MAG TPA: DUF2169 domain-containing protein [Myxococcaceae bacterium]|nr:DUF2169 domain-containing protein [Myxococcaceae bacterium]
MLQLQNETPFVGHLLILPDERGVDTAYVTVKATFEIAEDGLRIAAEQRPLVLADEYRKDPATSSLKHAGEIHLLKPNTDVVLLGEAHAPGGRPVKSCQVSIRVGRLHKLLQVFGDRHWTGGLVSPRISAPEPFTTLPLIYERAFGGTHVVDEKSGKAVAEERNPVGQGFRGKRSASEMLGSKLPNLEDPAHLIRSPSDCPAPSGVGYVAPSWLPRRAMAGTYDETWRTTRAPYLPLNFKREFFQMASPGLISAGHLRGGEPVEILNSSPEGAVRFALPTCAISVTLAIAGEEHEPRPQLETVQLEPGNKRLCLLWRAAVPCDKRALKVESARIQLDSLGGAKEGGR